MESAGNQSSGSQKTLTLELFTQWSVDSKQPSDVMLKLPEIFNRLESSDFLLQNFLKYSDTVRNVIGAHLYYNADPQEIGALYALRDKVNSDLANGTNWLQGSTLSMLSGVNDLETPPSRNFLKQVTYFKMLYPRKRNDAVHSWEWLSEMTALLLFAIYGEKRVLEVMTIWMEHRPSDKTRLFIDVVERWEEFADYPVEWTLNVIDIAQVTK